MVKTMETNLDCIGIEECLKLANEYGVTGSSAYQIILSVIPIVGIAFGCVLLLFIFYWNYKQRIRIIEKGMYRRVQFNLPLFSFFIGIVLTTVGLALSIFFLIMTKGYSYAMLGGIIPLFLGIGMIVFYLIIKNQSLSGFLTREPTIKAEHNLDKDSLKSQD